MTQPKLKAGILEFDSSDFAWLDARYAMPVVADANVAAKSRNVNSQL